MAEIISLSFYVIFSISICIAAYILYSNPRSWEVRVAFLIAFFTAIRNLGYSMRSVATSFNEAYFWTYFSAVGWTAFYILTFIWIYNYLFKRFRRFANGIALIAYVGMVWEFVISPRAAGYYNLIVSRYGIVDNQYFYGNSESLNDLGLTVVYIAVVILIVSSITVQFLHSNDQIRKKNLGILVSGVVLSVITSMIGDQLGQLVSEDPLPSFSPICSIFVLISMLIVLIKDGKVRSPGEVASSYRDIRDIEIRIWERIEIYVGVLGLGSFALNRIFFSGNYNSDEYLLLAASLLISFLMRMTRTWIKSKETIRYLLIFLLAIDVILFMTLGYKTSLIGIWFYPFCFLPLLVLLDNKLNLYIINGISILFAVSIVFNLGGKWSSFDVQGILQRFTLGVVFCLQLLYANAFYRKKTSYNHRLIEIQEKFAEITAFYIDINIDNFNYKTEEMLRLCREFIRADRVFMLIFDYKNDCFSNHIESLSDTISSTKNFMKHIRLSDMGWFFERLRKDGIVSIRDLKSLPPGAKSETLLFSWSGINSVYCAPIYSGTQLIGVIGQEKVKEDSILPKEEEDFVIFAANTQAEAFAKIESQKKINHMAYYNTLTNLPNRFEFRKRVQAFLDEHRNETFALAFLDLDSFQEINDIIGHDGGDELLVLLAREIARKISKDDIFAHYAGDEFAVLIKQVSSKHDVGQRVTDILNAVRIPKKILNREFFISASVGVSIYNEDAFSLDELIANSELAQYVAKRTGKNKFVICDEYMKIEHIHRLQLKKNLLTAVEKQEFVIEYQPILDAKTMKLEGLEALVRWDTMDYGRLYPNDFLKLADEVGVIVHLISYVLEECCVQIRKWRELGVSTCITVNLSCDSINHIDIYSIFKEKLQKYEIEGGAFVAEFSERYGYEIDNDMLVKLRELGVQISIDEFGSKNSSLSRIVKLSIDQVKIDIGFVQRIGTTSKDDGIAQSIIDIGSELGLKVTALGVENEEQYQFFKENACDCVQGHFFYKPMSADDTTDLLMFQSAPSEQKQ